MDLRLRTWLCVVSLSSLLLWRILPLPSMPAQSGVVTPDITPTHIAKLNQQELEREEAAMSTYIDLVLLARADCFVTGKSGFSMAAWWLGGSKRCVADNAHKHNRWRPYKPCKSVSDGKT